jgi:hypothetical protein
LKFNTSKLSDILDSKEKKENKKISNSGIRTGLESDIELQRSPAVVNFNSTRAIHPSNFGNSISQNIKLRAPKIEASLDN